MRTVTCYKLKKELPGLTFVPFDDELGTRIYENISADAWQMWLEYSKMLINEYRLDLATLDAFKFLHEKCEAFLFSEENKPPEGYQPAHAH